ncbi:molecular chaperone HscC [Clostridium estertheticum]|uniref:Chaperone protein DnaK n=1 Tax=Clostridium estertheticum TaxID=238834 RepID=A0A5N7IXK3_9CLOT|nr:molecular chaperone HscC [Clostridium estertheticum]MPQ30531.1 molecular chaperone HscC [Clostridium estertheticum]MPQ61207.1 molecular chaperone HscC [Clostridium estertheticum]
MAIIGIDLGTTNSLVAIWKDGRAQIIPNVLKNNLTPSVVSVDDNNEILIGDIAKERIITHPELTASNFKRFMGSSKKYYLGCHTFTPEELSSFILKRLIEDAEEYIGEKIIEAVISVPAYFNDAQRKATKRAGELAGIKVERLISEPTAAAIAYGLHQEKDDTQFLVFDLGGGTFDVSILELFEGVMEVKSIAGDNYLGGEDFNKLLVDYFEKTNKLDLKKLDKKVNSIVYKQAELCKKLLSNEVKAMISLTIDKKLYNTEIDRSKFEKLSSDLILKLRHPVERALRDACISPAEIEAIILIGGSTRMPLIKAVVTKMFNKLPYTNINPDEAVALGAAIQGALKEKHSDLKELVLTDVCPYSLGVEISNQLDNGNYESGYFLPIIERNSPIPISKVEQLVTIRDNQTKLLIKIYQGESRRVENNIELGELEIPVPRGKAGEHVVALRYTYDINGLLEIEATILSTGETETLIIENSPGYMSQEDIKKRMISLKDIKIHPRDRTENRLLLARGERLYEESLGDKREYISKLLNEFESILSTQDTRVIEKNLKVFTQRLNELEEYY